MERRLGCCTARYFSSKKVSQIIHFHPQCPIILFPPHNARITLTVSSVHPVNYCYCPYPLSVSLNERRRGDPEGVGQSIEGAVVCSSDFVLESSRTFNYSLLNVVS